MIFVEVTQFEYFNKIKSKDPKTRLEFNKDAHLSNWREYSFTSAFMKVAMQMFRSNDECNKLFWACSTTRANMSVGNIDEFKSKMEALLSEIKEFE